MSLGEFSVSDHGITFPKGYRASGLACGIKRSLRPDLALLVSERPATVAGLFTTNRVRAAPVEICEGLLREHPGEARGLVVVSGVANALTGPEGLADSRRVIELAEGALKLPQGSVYHAATGVIGPRIPVERVESHLPQAVHALASDRPASTRAATAILTTDTRTKEAAVSVRLADGTRARLGGMAKGSGMIAPSVGPPHATTLAFLTTDARVSTPGWQGLLTREADRTFNMISVDGDTSTNDTVLAFANGEAGGALADDDPALARGVAYVLERLARSVARDGEGATKLLTVNVHGAADAHEARQAARSVASSLLVKTALFGADPNVGRIACALGYSGATFETQDLDVRLVDGPKNWPLILHGTPAPGLDNGQGHRLHNVLQRLEEVVLDVQLGNGPARATAWGCDLSYGYVQINAQYRT
ncbi:MAG: bifunctional glutamate N-acetyltransferase/amino-acid acetyltransferase ArgJ [Euryarchaeota archaeon]|nr:bifunctional glutamate N-acetyltransferase/amino-acid acetyltransferase ArgJ [Euryarchaeota archaeon]MDE1835306.1 bifunctional glutamate N-acetyltransferase/amino-acid acetyltransferase ArgJ [Euryarchaeota archaeon]MDE2043602.1 bifunctional glutamate N-acetyltransferase/amino-acid acetyltransferase ArgJ [Thermoplasmata archaeon]